MGERIRLMRSRLGLSLRDLEARIDHLVSAQAIGKYERGQMMPSPGVLVALSNALGVSRDYFTAEAVVQLEGLEFRKKPVASKREETQIEATVVDLLQRYLQIEEILQAPSRAWDRPREGRFPVVELGNFAQLAHNPSCLSDDIVVNQKLLPVANGD